MIDLITCICNIWCILYVIICPSINAVQSVDYCNMCISLKHIHYCIIPSTCKYYAYVEALCGCSARPAAKPCRFYALYAWSSAQISVIQWHEIVLFIRPQIYKPLSAMVQRRYYLRYRSGHARGYLNKCSSPYGLDLQCDAIS